MLYGDQTHLGGERKRRKCFKLLHYEGDADSMEKRRRRSDTGACAGMQGSWSPGEKKGGRVSAKTNISLKRGGGKI